MAHLLRLIVGALLWCVIGAAHAIIPMQSFSYQWNNVRYPSAESVCQAWFATKTTGGNVARWEYKGYRGTNGQSVYCLATGYTSQNTVWVNDELLMAVTSTGTCPANSSQVSGGCQCNANYIEDPTKTSCIPKPDDCVQLAGKSAGTKDWWGKQDSYTFCDGWNALGGGKCTATAFREVSFEVPPGSGKWLSQGNAVYTGNRASSCLGNGDSGDSPANSTPTPDGQPPNTPAPGEAAPSPCPTGQAPGEVNGTRVCAPRGADVPAEGRDSTTTKNPDGSTTRTDRTTRCDGTKCQTDTRVCKAAAGGLETCETTTTEQGQSGFCEKSGNKDDKVCQGQGEGPPSSFGGSCATGFKAVSEDAVLNAMAQEQHKRNCETLRTDTEPSTWVTAEGQKTGNAMQGNPNNSTVSVGPGNFDTSDALGGGGCSLNKTITVRGYTAVLPFNVLCDPLAVLGQILVAVSLLLAGRILTRG